MDAVKAAFSAFVARRLAMLTEGQGRMRAKLLMRDTQRELSVVTKRVTANLRARMKGQTIVLPEVR